MRSSSLLVLLAASSPAVAQVTLTPYVDPLPLPSIATPTSGSPGGAADYEIPLVQFQQQLHSELPPTTLWGYDGQFPGPTIEAWRGEPVTVTWKNDLRDAQGNLRSEHILPVDPCPHGAFANDVRTVAHLHGGHVRPEFDGYPEFTQLPGEQVTYEYPNHQEAAAIWYHDHALGITRLNVMMGLAGMYIIRDQEEADLDLPQGVNEVPLVVMDKTFNPDGSLSYPAVWTQHFFGDKVLVNGKVWPYLEVPRGKVRFRVLNASNSRTFTFSLSNGASFQVIGGDGGLLPAPVTVTEQTLTSAERSDWIIDFESYAPGTEILLTNSAPAPFPGNPGIGVVPEVMKFVVTGDAGDTDPIPTTLRPLRPLPESSAVEERMFLLRKQPEPCAGQHWLINDLGWDDITEFPTLGTTETWTFANPTGIGHPMHMHLVFFQVLDRTPFSMQGGEIVPTGPPVPPDPTEAGWKDTVDSPPYMLTRVIARFTDYEGKFAYHCHILEHEDHEMMRQFQTVQGPGTPYCMCPVGPCGNHDPEAGCATSTGYGAYLSGHGSAAVSADDLVLTTAIGTQAGGFGVYFRGQGATLVPFGDGNRCVGAGAVIRLPVSAIPADGVVTVGPGLVAGSIGTGAGNTILAGQTWNWQFWFRDPQGPCGNAFNLSNALAVPFTP